MSQKCDPLGQWLATAMLRFFVCALPRIVRFYAWLDERLCLCPPVPKK